MGRESIEERHSLFHSRAHVVRRKHHGGRYDEEGYQLPDPRNGHLNFCYKILFYPPMYILYFQRKKNYVKHVNTYVRGRFDSESLEIPRRTFN